MRARRPPCPWICTLALLIACGDAAAPPAAADPDAGNPPTTDADALEHEAKFWNEVSICGEAVEGHETISRAADDADVALVGRFVDVAVGNIVQGDAAEDFYAEVNVTVRVEETLRHEAAASIRMSLILASVTRASLDSTVRAMRAALPARPIVLLLRERGDIADLYRALGGDRVLWTQTIRGPLDNPIASDSCLGRFGPELRGFLEGSDSVEALIARLRA